jgi:MFS family permease
MSTANPPSPGGGTKGTVLWAILVTGLASFMAGLDNLVIITALPTIKDELGGSLSDLEWTVNAYTLSFAVLMMFGAALGDRFGRHRGSANSSPPAPCRAPERPSSCRCRSPC